MQNQSIQETTVRHMIRPHHQDIVYREIDPLNPKLRQIDTSSTPASKYKELLSGVFKDQLRQGLNESMAKKVYMDLENQAVKDQYNRMCEHNALLERNNILRRREYYNAIQDQQNRREQYFVDGNRAKSNRIQKHIQATGKDNLFFKLQDQYDIYKKHNQESYSNTLSGQMQQKQVQNQLRRQQKQNQTNHRKRIEQYLAHLNSQQKQQQFQSKMIYKQQLDKLIQSKSPRRNSRPMITPHPRHNPITNPIDHHVDNPYIMKKIMNRLNRQSSI